MVFKICQYSEIIYYILIILQKSKENHYLKRNMY